MGTKTSSRFLAPDGVRALAVAAVVLLHMELSGWWYNGGQAGVTVFFVLSGYLITSILLKEHDKRGNVSWKNFYKRRAARLVPAMLLAVAITAFLSWSALGIKSASWDLYKYTIVPSLGQFLNIQFATSDQTLAYELVPMWSLNIEEQFYAGWSIILIAVVYIVKKQKINIYATVTTLAATLATASFSWSWWLASNGATYERTAYATDTQLGAVLTGVALAGALGLYHKKSPSFLNNPWINTLLAAGGLFTVLWFLSGLKDPYLYKSGQILLSLGTAALIAGIVTGDKITSKILAFPVLVWIGQRSYMIYLIHVGVLQAWGGPSRNLWVSAGILLTIAAIAELSYRYVEMPIINKVKQPVGKPERKLVARYNAGATTYEPV